MTLDAFIEMIGRSLDPAALAEFGPMERESLKRSMELCKMKVYPLVHGPLEGERTSGDRICDRCGQDFFHHPYDWRVIGYGNVPFLNITCDGFRVKL
jgi:hypothetical protein